MRARALLATVAALVVVVSTGCVGLPAADSATGTRTDVAGPRPSVTGTDPGATPSAGPGGTPTATPRPTPDVTVDERVEVNGSLPVNASLVFARVERLVGVNASAPGVHVSNESGRPPQVRTALPPFGAFGANRTTGRLDTCGAIASGSAGGEEVDLGIGGLSTEQVELLLVHEYVHVLQDQSERLRIDDGGQDDRNPVVDRALSEGGAVYVAHRYASRYGRSWGNRSILSLRRCFFRQSSDPVRVYAGWYYFGAMHFVRRLGDSGNLSRVYANPPRTTEQLIHGLPPGSEPPKPLSVSVGEGSREPGQRGREGELKLRTMLVSALPPERAAAATGGWGNDTLLSFRGEGSPNFAWVVRLDDPGEADEFAAAFREYESRVEQRGDAHVRLVRVSPETVVLFAGSEGFVGNASASGTNGKVTVTVPGGGKAFASAHGSAGRAEPLLVPFGVGVTERGLA